MSGVEKRLAPWVGFIGDLLSVPLTSMPHEPIFDQLLSTFPAAGVTYNWSQQDGRLGLVGHPKDVLKPFREVIAAWEQGGLLDQHPLATWYVVSGDIRPTTCDRVPTSIVPARGRNLVLTTLRQAELDRQLSIPFKLDRTIHQAYVLGRGGSDFSDDDVAVATQIQRALVGLSHQTAILRDALDRLEAPNDALGLTPRELAILRLVSIGASTRAIAGRLRCSPRTVHKHLEHAYRKLGVRDRISAIRVIRSGLCG